MTRALLLCAAVLGSLAIGGAHADADSVGTYQLKGTFKNSFLGILCPAGSTATNCYRNASVDGAVIPGLGKISTKYTLLLDFAGSCGYVHAQIPIFVAGKGEIDLETRSTGCIAPDQLMIYPPSDVTVTGGSGLYAGASGSGVLNYENHEPRPGSGSSVLTWTGTLSVAGLAFDTTPPQIAGAKSRTAKTRAATGTRVRYSVSAADAVDGKVLSSCKPKSGSVFRVGRTTVTCTAVDGSANTATKRFVITVKRVRRSLSATNLTTGALQVNSTFSAKWHRGTCPAGVPSTLTCYPSEAQALVRGLGRVTATYMTTFDEGGTRCIRVLPDLLLTVAGKGSVTASMTGPACMALPPSQSLFDAVVTGGSGKYEGASGSIHIRSNSFERAPGEGVSTDVYTGTLNVSGLEFDLTAPVFSGAHSKTVRAAKGARRVKVRYVVTAKDAVDGPVVAICKLRSGAFFKIGRTRVTCTARDSSANTGTARFTVTVMPARR